MVPGGLPITLLHQTVNAVDPFHVVEWAMDALDKVRRGVKRESKGFEIPPILAAKGRPRKDDASSKEASEAKSADEIKKLRICPWEGS